MDRDIIYPLINSKWNDLELMYSLRSVEKHLKGYRNIYIIGDTPVFPHKNLILCSFENNPNLSSYNIMAKIREACGLPTVSEDFIVMNDDIFFIEDDDLNSHQKYDGSLMYNYSKLLNRRGSVDSYTQLIINTVEEFQRYGIVFPLYFDVHYPAVYNKEKFIWSMSQFSWEKKEMLIKSIYYNTWTNPNNEQYEDCKIRRRREVETLDSSIKGKTCFSISENAMQNPKMIEWLINKYPNKSKYEI